MTPGQPLVRRVMKMGESLYINTGIVVQQALGIKAGDMVTLAVKGDTVIVRKVDFAAAIRAAEAKQQRSARSRGKGDGVR